MINLRVRSFLIGASFITISHIANGNEPLVDAAKFDDFNLVISLIESGTDVNSTSADGTTALSYAVYNNNKRLADYLLLKAEADVDIVNDYGASALYLASINADPDVVDKLLTSGANPDVSLLSGETSLMGAANRGRQDVVKLLLDHGADPNRKEINSGQTALMWAAAEKHPDVVQLLVQHNADTNARSNNSFTPLMFAVRQGDENVSTVEILINAGANVNDVFSKSGLTPLMLSSIGGFEKITELLLNHGADPTAKDNSGNSVLHHAVINPNINIIKDLLAHGSNPNEQLVTKKSDYNMSRNGITPFLAAVEANNYEGVLLLLGAGADPFLTTEQGTTALMLSAGASVNPTNYIPTSEIEAATSIAKLLIERGADVNSVGAFGWSALHAAAYHGRNEIIDLLIHKGADPNRMDDFGQTPLSISYAIVTEGMGDNYNQTPRTFRRDTADLLLSSGATPLEASGVKILSQRASE